jgi:hypothetical protein
MLDHIDDTDNEEANKEPKERNEKMLERKRKPPMGA